MLYFLINQSDNINAILEHNPHIEAVGCNKWMTPSPHFSGNMWIARKSYIASLPRPMDITLSWGPSWKGRCRAEMFIGLGGPENLYCIHDSKVDHYCTRYPEWIYRQK